MLPPVGREPEPVLVRCGMEPPLLPGDCFAVLFFMIAPKKRGRSPEQEVHDLCTNFTTLCQCSV